MPGADLSIPRLSPAAAEWIACGLYGLALSQRGQQLQLWPPPRMDLGSLGKEMAPFVRAGGAVLMRTALLLGTKTLASAAAARLGAVPIAAHQVVGQLWTLFSLVVDSLAVSGQALVAIRLGQNRPQEAKEISDRLIELGAALGTVVAVLLAAGGPVIPGVFTGDQGVADQIYQVLPLAIAVLPVNAYVYVLDGVLVGAEQFPYLAQAMTLSAGATLAALGAVEPLHLGLPGVWGAMALLMVLRAVTLRHKYESMPWEQPAAATAAPAAAAPADWEDAAVISAAAQMEQGGADALPEPVVAVVSKSEGGSNY